MDKGKEQRARRPRGSDGRGTERESDTRLQPSNKNSPEQYMTAIIGTYGPDSHFPRSLCALAFQTYSNPFPSSLSSFLLLSLCIPAPFLFLSSSFAGVDVHQTGTLPTGPPPCGGTRPLLIINISRTRSQQKSGAANIVRTLTLGSSY